MKKRCTAWLFAAALSFASAGPGLAASCQAEVDAIVKDTTTSLLRQVLKDNPELAELDETELVLQSGRTLVAARRGAATSKPMAG